MNHYAHEVYGISDLPNPEEIALQWAKDDIQDFKQNKNRYTMEVDEAGEQTLKAIDGKPI